jgi:hypothetical protein
MKIYLASFLCFLFSFFFIRFGLTKNDADLKCRVKRKKKGGKYNVSQAPPTKQKIKRY